MSNYSIKGTFKSLDNEKTYYVQIGDGENIIDIIDAPNGTANEVYFSGESPVVLSSDNSDTFEHLYIRSASISLIANFDLRPYVVAGNYNDIPVEIREDDDEGSIIFTGYVLPLQYNQDFAQTYNEFTVECIDKLGLLEYIKLPPLLNNNYSYRTARSFINLIFNKIGFSTLSGNLVYNIAYDQTANTYINPVIFIGESEDDWMTCNEALEEIGKLYGCYYWQDGDVVNVKNLLLYNTNDPEEVVKADYMDEDTNISIDTAYNQIKCTVDLSTIDETVIDPFDNDNFEPTTEKAERVLTELMYKNKEEKYDNVYKFKNYCDMAYNTITPIRDWHTLQHDDENFEVYDNYCQVVKNNNFTFYPVDANYLNDVNGGVATMVEGNPVPITSNSINILKWLYAHPGRGAFLSMGKTNNLTDINNKAMPKINDMSTKLYIQVNGNRSSIIPSGTAEEKNHAYNTSIKSYLSSQFSDNNPICSFELNSSNNIVPNDTSVVNYLVISGKILLNPIMPITGPFYYDEWDDRDDYHPSGYPYNTYIRRLNTLTSLETVWENWTARYSFQSKADSCVDHCVKNNEDDEGYYYQIYTWDNMANPSYIYSWPYDQNPNYQTNLALPYLSPKYENFLYNKSTYDDEATQTDTLSQVSILACELKIGDYYLIEDFSLLEQFNWNVPANMLGQLYKWRKYEDCPVRDGQVQTWFTLSIDPGIGDFVVGKEYNIKNTVSIQTGIDAEGTAIPIYYDADLTGPLTFKILSPYHTLWWNKFLYFSWAPYGYNQGVTYDAIMSYVENIQLSDLKFSLYSNNKKGSGDNDLVYVSDTSGDYIEDNDFECKFCSALKNSEITQGIEYKPNNSALMYMNNNKLEPWTGMTYKGTAGVKLEEARVREQYDIWCKPRNIVETTIKLSDAEKSLIETNYYFNYLKKMDQTYQIYKIIEREVDLKRNTMKCKMKDFS